MILFEEDWAKYPSAIPDFKTSNKSFLELAAKLRKMGIRNCLFMLALHQPELQGVDPYADNLTLEQKQMIQTECEYNPWYFLREIVRIPPISGLDPVPYRANRANISMTWAFLNHIAYMLIQPRQTGKSVSTDALTSWLYLCALRNARMLLITKSDDLRADNILRLRKMRSYLPKWLVFEDRTDANNTQMVTYNLRGNIYRTAVGQNSEDSATKVGRGATVPVVHIDEGPFIPYIDIVIQAALSAGNAARDEAARNGLPYGNIFTTTAGKIDSRSGGYMYKMLEGSCTWGEHLYDCKDEAELRTVVKANATGKMTLISGVFSHRQLGYTDEWLYGKMAETGSEGEEADRDYFNRWTSGGLSSPLTVNTLTAILRSEMDPVHQAIYPDGYVLKWYVDELSIKRAIKENRSYIIGVDTSDAIGRDAIAISVIDSTDLATVAAADINETNLIKAAKWVAKLLIEHPNTTLIIEKKSSAQTFIDTAIIMLLNAGIDPFKRIFNRLVDERTTRSKEYDEVHKTPLARRTVAFYDKYRHLFGFNTTGESRELLYSKVLINASKRAAGLVRDRKLSGELRTLQVKNGRIDHSTKGHDDMVISWLLTHWLLIYGRNLDYYGIDVSKIMLRVGTDGDIASPEELIAKARRENLKVKLEEITEKLKSTDNVHQVIMFENELRLISMKLEQMGDESLSIDSLIRDAATERTRRLKSRHRTLRAA